MDYLNSLHLNIIISLICCIQHVLDFYIFQMCLGFLISLLCLGFVDFFNVSWIFMFFQCVMDSLISLTFCWFVDDFFNLSWIFISPKCLGFADFGNVCWICWFSFFLDILCGEIREHSKRMPLFVLLLGVQIFSTQQTWKTQNVILYTDDFCKTSKAVCISTV